MLQLLKKWRGRGVGEGRTLGISLTEDSLSLALIREQRGQPFLEHCEHILLPDDEPLRDWLPRQISERGLQDLPCNVLLSSPDYNLYLIEAPRVEESEMRAAVRWKVKDLLDIPLEDAAIDVFPVPEDAFQGRSRMLYVVAAQRSRVQSLIELIGRAGLALRCIDIPELAMRNITARFADDTNGLAFMALKTHGSSLNLTRNGALYLTRKISSQVAQGAMQAPDWEQLRDRLVLEVQRSLDYYESQMGQNAVSRVLLAPRGADAAELASSLDEALFAEVGVLRLAELLPHHEAIEADSLRASMLAIGAALRSDEGMTV